MSDQPMSDQPMSDQPKADQPKADQPKADQPKADQPTADQPLSDFADDMRLLRERCPWKAEQTHRSLERYLLEEAHEVIEAIDVGDPAHLREELGDLLLQVYFHAVIAEEAGEFTLDDVARGIADKMRRRNPHVFGSERAGTAAEVNHRWQEIKAAEGHRSSVLDGLPPTLPALLLAEKALDRLDRAGVPGLEGDPSTMEGDPSAVARDPSAVARDPSTVARDPSAVARDPSAIGERLWGIVEDARAAGVDPEQALRDVVRRRAQADPTGEPLRGPAGAECPTFN